MAGPTQLISPFLRVAISTIAVLGLAAPPGAAHAAGDDLLSGETLGAGSHLAHVSVLEPQLGRVTVYGPAIWSGAELGDDQLPHRLGCLNGGNWDNCIIPAVDGELLSSPSLRGGHGHQDQKLRCLHGGNRDNCIFPPVDGELLSSPLQRGGHGRRDQKLRCLHGGNWDNCIVVGNGELLSSPLLRGSRGRRDQKLRCLHGGNWDNCIISGAAPAAEGVLFSGAQRLGLRGGCGGGRCFLRLDNRGGLAVVDDDNRAMWSNDVSSAQGEYVAVLRRGGEVAVYGPAIWSTGGGAAEQRQEVITGVNRKIGDVKMVTDRRE